MECDSHILNAASNLLGIALLIVTGIHITANADKSHADGVALAAAILLSLSCVVSYLSIRRQERGAGLENWADRIFLCGLGALVIAVIILATSLR